MTTTTTKKTAPVLSADQKTAYDKLVGPSAQIRYLSSLGYPMGDIARYTGKRFQHVRNVLITPLKRPTN